MEEELQAKPVQEIARSIYNNGDMPDNFIHKNSYPQAKIDSVPWMDHLLIDLSLLSASSSSSSSSSPEVQHELAKLQLALSQWGCFQAINHGLTSTFLDKLREVTKQFFTLPLEEKQKYSRSKNDWDGYGNDTIVSEHQTLDWCDRLYLTVHPVDQRKLNYWPEKPLEFRDVIHEYTMKLEEMFGVVLKAMAQSLNLEENCFLEENGDVLKMDARFNFYPRCPSPEDVLGLKPHADGVTVTMLLPDKEVVGLQVLKDDQWFRVPIIPDALFINVGDMLEIMSNGILKSPVHRVVTNSEKERISLSVFCYPDPEREIGPVTGLITADRPQAYKRVKHYDQLFFEYYQQGQRPLHAVKL